MEEQNKTTESGQAAADLDKSLAHLETATRLTGLVVELQKAAANLDAYAASLLGSDDIIVDKAASTRQNGPAAVGNAAEEYLESLEQRFQLVPTGTNVDFDLGFLGLLAIDTSPLSYRKLDLTTIRRLITILGGPDPYATHHEGRHRVEDCITRDIHDYRHYLETIQLKDCGK